MGLREAKAAANSGRRILVATHQMAQISRAKEESETFGLIRLVVDADTDKFLGATVLGFNGDEIIAIISNFMASGSKRYQCIRPWQSSFRPYWLSLNRFTRSVCRRMLETDLSRRDKLDPKYEINHPIATHLAGFKQRSRCWGGVEIEADDVGTG